MPVVCSIHAISCKDKPLFRQFSAINWYLTKVEKSCNLHSNFKQKCEDREKVFLRSFRELPDGARQCGREDLLALEQPG